MLVKVVDASALAAVLFGEADAEEVTPDLDGCHLAAPALLSYEIASVCLKKMRRHPADRAVFAQASGRLSELGVAETDVDIEVLLLAERKRLTSYDASYLWLAVELGAELVTLDRRLAAAAVRS